MIDIEASRGNVYADLNVPAADDMLIKAQLVTRIGDLIQARGWSQQQAATVLGLTQPKLSNLLRGQFRGISQARLLACLARLGHDVRIVIGPAQPPPREGHIEVVFT